MAYRMPQVRRVRSTTGPLANVPVWVLLVGLKGNELAVYVALRSFADSTNHAHLRLKDIARRAGVSHSTAKRAVAVLVELGLVEADFVYDENSRAVVGCDYTFIDVRPDGLAARTDVGSQGPDGVGSHRPDPQVTQNRGSGHTDPTSVHRDPTGSGHTDPTVGSPGDPTKTTSSFQEEELQKPFLSGTPSAPPDEQKTAATKKPKRDLNVGRADAAELCHLLADLMVENGCVRPTVSKDWLDAARLMLDKDGRDFAKARELVRWCQGDKFWKTNIHSMPTFREQYDKLRLRAVEEWEGQREAAGQGKPRQPEVVLPQMDHARILRGFAESEAAR